MINLNAANGELVPDLLAPHLITPSPKPETKEEKKKRWDPRRRNASFARNYPLHTSYMTYMVHRPCTCTRACMIRVFLVEVLEPKLSSEMAFSGLHLEPKLKPVDRSAASSRAAGQ
ncbi:hypothetical protein TWF569_010436 [Orbilia oligospora]|nr:hypothetical protein TWF706_001117 [Orbilia oligospora]KAF3133459.1 hypothetical protein TWF569_010436 [Orbilia oligospora]KAF3143587.1 hypothetical protein TWF594_005135 [Orbilia oligospora]